MEQGGLFRKKIKTLSILKVHTLSDVGGTGLGVIRSSEPAITSVLRPWIILTDPYRGAAGCWLDPVGCVMTVLKS